VLDQRLLRLLDDRDVRYCVIGGVALAVHGHARYTADLDLLTMDPRVLSAGFWPADAPVEIRHADADDPLGGLVRWSAEPPHDLLVGRGYAMQLAVDTAQRDPTLGAPVATALALLLLKLEAGGAQDRWDAVALVRAKRALGTPDSWLDDVERHVARTSEPARATWARVREDLND